jgi:putative FmdB family regulatory protein
MMRRSCSSTIEASFIRSSSKPGQAFRQQVGCRDRPRPQALDSAPREARPPVAGVGLLTRLAGMTRAGVRRRRAGARIPAMPIYEYECHDCHRRVSLLIMRPSTAPTPACPRCGSTALTRLMSRFATVKSEEERLDSIASSADFAGLDEDDPASVARFMKKMGREMGDDLGDDFESAVDEAMDEGAGEEGAPSESLDTSGASDDT